MKNVDKLYEKPYNAYKNDYDNDDLTEAKKKEFGCKQSEFFDETDEEAKLDEELKLDKKTKNLLKRLKIKKKALIKRDLRNIFDRNLLHQ